MDDGACLQPVEPDLMEEDDIDEDQRQDEAFHHQYENEHTWENLQEDEHGLLRIDRTSELRAKRQRTLLSSAQSASVRKGMIRYMLLVLDVSGAAGALDLRPNRLACMLQAARDFVRNFFDQNPLSQLGIILLRNGVAERLTDLSGSPEAQLRRLDAANLSATGAVSLQNALDTGVALLRNIPPYGHREMLVLFAALSTCDPGNIFDSIKEAKAAKIRVSLVGVAAEVHVCRRMTQETGGSYGIALNETHLSDLLLAHAPPPPALAGNTGAELVCMGFPDKGPDAPASAVFVGAEARLCAGGYVCPRCAARVAELPGECHVCGLTLISSPHLARSYHHLFPVPRYDELPPEQVFDLIGTQQQLLQDSRQSALAQMQSERQQGQGMADGLKGPEVKHQGLKHKWEAGFQGPPVKKQCVDMDGGRGAGLQGLQGVGEVPHALYCFGCLLDLTPPAVNRFQLQGRPGPPPPMVLQCPQCKHTFCFECDAYVHEQLHNCPGCECAQQQQQLQQQKHQQSRQREPVAVGGIS